jgi:hypothetical protein
MNNNGNGSGTIAAKETLIFLHIPKTAGTTLNRIIDRQYNPLRIYTTHGGRVEWSISRLRNFSESRRRRYQVVRGHMSFGVHEFLPQPCTYITMLREPVDRVLSAYYYIFRRPKHPFYKQVVEDKGDVKKYLEITPHRANFQCKLLAGVDENAPLPNDCLERAKENLTKHFRVVGLSERFDESLILMNLAFGWDVPFFMNWNVTAKRAKKQQIDPETLEAIKEHNQFDLAIYDLGKKMFEEMLEKKKDAIEAEIDRIKNKAPQNPVARFCYTNVTLGRYYVSKLSSLI